MVPLMVLQTALTSGAIPRPFLNSAGRLSNLISVGFGGCLGAEGAAVVAVVVAEEEEEGVVVVAVVVAVVACLLVLLPLFGVT